MSLYELDHENSYTDIQEDNDTSGEFNDDSNTNSYNKSKQFHYLKFSKFKSIYESWWFIYSFLVI